MMKRILHVLAVAALLMVPLHGRAAAPAGDELKFVTTDELKAMMDSSSNVVLINALSPLEFTQTKIKGSVNIPYGHLKKGRASLPEDRGSNLIFYCKGPK